MLAASIISSWRPPFKRAADQRGREAPLGMRAPVVPGSPEGPEAGHADDQQRLDGEGQWVHPFLPLLAAGEATEGAADAAFAVHQGAAAVGAAGAPEGISSTHRSSSPEHSFSNGQRIAERLFFVKGFCEQVFERHAESRRWFIIGGFLAPRFPQDPSLKAGVWGGKSMPRLQAGVGSYPTNGEPGTLKATVVDLTHAG